jgi:mannose-6-phosphate isomerase class I
MTDPFVSPLPAEAERFPRGPYDPAPAFATDHGPIERGYEALAAAIARSMPRGLRVLAVDGFHGVDWSDFREHLGTALAAEGVEPEWIDMAECLLAPDAVAPRIEPFLGGDDPIFGRHFPLGLDSFFDPVRVADVRVRASIRRGRAAGALTIIYGCGAGLAEQHDALWYADVPKDVLQEHARAGARVALTTDRREPFNLFYKRAYFVEWPALNRQKQRLLPLIDRFLDLQDPEVPASMPGEALRATLADLAATPFRARPWFYPGPWGGKFMQGHMGLDPEAPNFAWSFELITPENGVVFEHGGERLECSFDLLMYQENRRVLGAEAARQFGHEWPIRFDYLDTVSGGNLSVQCHPRPDYIRREFGETFTQDETYYISAAQPEALVYLGMQEGADPEAFRQDLMHSARTGEAVDFERYVYSRPSRPHDLFLIPNGTVHCSGRGNLVLEISATPYIFTFKIYDYLRRDLAGNLRPINVDRAWENLRFERTGDWVEENLVARPRLLREGPGWTDYVLSDRPEFFYDIHRLEFDDAFTYETEGRALAVNLVEGEAVVVRDARGRDSTLRYLESMVIPAAAERVTVTPVGDRPCKLVLVFVRPGVGSALPLNDPI